MNIMVFERDNELDLRDAIKEFAKTHNIEQISYTISSHEYRYYYSCCILYTEKGNFQKLLTNF